MGTDRAGGAGKITRAVTFSRAPRPEIDAPAGQIIETYLVSRRFAEAPDRQRFCESPLNYFVACTLRISTAGSPSITRISGRSGVIERISCQEWSDTFRWAGPTRPLPKVASMPAHWPLTYTSVHMWK